MQLVPEDPVLTVLIALVIIFVAAKIGAVLADRLGQAIVLGELFAGLVLGNTYLFDFIKHNSHIELLAALGVIVLLFEAGLESNITEMKSLGLESFSVALVGVILPFTFAYYGSAYLMPELSELSRIFLGATFTATSVAITARVFKDLNLLQSREAKIVLGAAVIDDILGLMILAVVTALAQASTINSIDVLFIAAKAFMFLLLSILFGRVFVDYGFKLAARASLPGTMMMTALAFCFALSYLASLAGLAPIVGAFAAGLILDELHFTAFKSERKLEDYIRPVSYFLGPIFFVVAAMQVDLRVFGDLTYLWIALAMSALAIIAKLLSAWSFRTTSPISRLMIGFAMIPRGEVALIFASTGKALGLVDDKLYAIVIILVMITTFLAPVLMTWGRTRTLG